ncbi:MAG: hypothetical protein JWM83_392 [Candidatus Angelobacter sp.]|nr:hypothetical protein [Candidatus Angelobacter sp.]
MAVGAHHREGVRASARLRPVGSDPEARPDFTLRPVGSDLAPASAASVPRRELTASQPLLHHAGHYRREALCPGSMSSLTVPLDFVAFITGASKILTTASVAARPSSLGVGFFWDHLSIPPTSLATTMAIIPAMGLRLNNNRLS